MKNLKILIVEDEAIVALHIKRQLINCGYDVVAVAAKGENAVKIGRDKNPDIVIMDIGLASKMSGIQTAEEMLTFCNPFFIFTTGYNSEKFASEIGLMGGIMIQKPVDINELLKIISTHVNQSD